MDHWKELLAPRVDLGARFLDRMDPGWHRKIVAERLAMETCDRCILGQLHGDFRKGFRKILAPLPSTNIYSAARLGFTLHDAEQSEDTPEVRARFKMLADLWRDEVRERLEATP